MNAPMNSELSHSLAVKVSKQDINDSKQQEIANASARLIANNKARALAMLKSMTQQLESNTVSTVTTVKKGIY